MKLPTITYALALALLTAVGVAQVARAQTSATISGDTSGTAIPLPVSDDAAGHDAGDDNGNRQNGHDAAEHAGGHEQGDDSGHDGGGDHSGGGNQGGSGGHGSDD